MHGSIISKLRGRGDATKCLICIFRNDLLNIKTTTNDFFVSIDVIVRPKGSGCRYVACRVWHKRNQLKCRLSGSDAPTLQLLQ